MPTATVARGAGLVERQLPSHTLSGDEPGRRIRAALREHGALLAAAAAVLVLALGLRVGHLISLQGGLADTHLFSTGRVDAAFHLREARQIVTSDPWLLEHVPWKGPGYSYFLAALRLLAGPDPGAYRWLVGTLGAINCAGLVLLARRFLGLGGALLAGCLVAVNGVLVLYDGELYFPTLLIALNLPALGLLLRRRPAWWTDGLAGGLVGLAVLVHPSYLLAAAAIGLHLVRGCGRRAAAFALAVAATIAPVTVKNVIVHGQAVLVSWSGGINFYVGNQPGYDQTSGQSTPAWDRVYHTPLDAGFAGEAERDRLYYRLAWRQVLDAPGTAVRILLTKTRIFLAPVEISNNFRLDEVRDRSAVLRATMGRLGALHLPFGVWAPLAWTGAVLLALRRQRGHGLVLWWSAALMLSCVLFFNTARYRVPVVFVGTVWCAAALEAAWRAAGARRFRQLAAGCVVVAGGILLTAALAEPQRIFPAPLELTEAATLEQLGRPGAAARWIDRAVAAHPTDPGVLLQAAGFHERHGRPAAARALLEQVLDLPDPGPDDRSRALEALAESRLAVGDLEGAAADFRAARDVGVDDATWRGVPFFRMGLGPVTRCRLRLGLAEVALLDGRGAEAERIIEAVLRTCGAHGRIGARLERLTPLREAARLRAPDPVRGSVRAP